MTTKIQIQTGPLPKIQGSGRKPAGLWAGHAEEATALRQLAVDKPQDWAKIATGMKTHAASRVAHLINNGEAIDFPRTDKGSYQARTRRSETGSEYDVWARFVPTLVPSPPI